MSRDHMKCLLRIFLPSFTPALFPPSPALIDQWQNLGDVCFIKCLNVFLFLLAKQGIGGGQPYVTERGVKLKPQKEKRKKKPFPKRENRTWRFFLSCHQDACDFPAGSERGLFARRSYVCVHERLAVLVYMFRTQTTRWYLVSGVSAADI